MGRVYEAQDTAANHKAVAIKEMLQKKLAPDDLKQAQIRFGQEADILRQLTLTPQPHIPTFYTSFYENGRFYLVMDFIPGKTLHTLLLEAQRVPVQGQVHDPVPLPIGQVLDYALQLCEVLSLLHRQKKPIIFRDLKPSNVIVRPDGTLYLIDFGIARRFKVNQYLDTELIGTMGYMSPELGTSQTDERADLYSLGATLFHCLTGYHPRFNTPDIYHFAEPRLINSQVPAGLSALILHLVATAKEDRPDSAEQVSSTLRRILQFNDDPTEGTLTASTYNQRLALEAVLRRNLTRVARLPGSLGKVWVQLLFFMALLGSWGLYLGQQTLPLFHWIGRFSLNTSAALQKRLTEAEERRRLARASRPPKSGGGSASNGQGGNLPVYEPISPQRRNSFQQGKLGGKPPVYEPIGPQRGKQAALRKPGGKLPTATYEPIGPRRSKQAAQANQPNQRLAKISLGKLGALAFPDTSGQPFMPFFPYLFIRNAALILATYLGFAFLFPETHDLFIPILGVCGLFVASVISTRRISERSTQAMLATLMLAILLICAVVLARSDLITHPHLPPFEQIISGLLFVLGILSVTRRSDRPAPFLHLAISAGILACAVAQYRFFTTQEIGGIPIPLPAEAIKYSALTILLLAAVLPLLLVKTHFTIIDGIVLAIASLFCWWQCTIFGQQALSLWFPGLSLQVYNGIAIALIIVLITLAVLAYFFRGSSSWVVPQVAVPYFLFTVILFSRYALRQPPPTLPHQLRPMLDVITHLHPLVVGLGLVLLLYLVLLSRKKRFLPFDVLLIAALALGYLQLHNELEPTNDWFIVAVIAINLLLLLPAPILYCLSLPGWGTKLIAGIDHLLCLLSYCLLVCVAFDYVRLVLSPYTRSLLSRALGNVTPGFLIVTVIIAICTLGLLVGKLRQLAALRSKSAQAKSAHALDDDRFAPVAARQAQAEKRKDAGTTIGGALYYVVIIALLISFGLLEILPGKQPGPPLPLSRQPSLSLLFTEGVLFLGIVLACAGFFVWQRKQVEAQESNFKLLIGALLLCGLAAMCCLWQASLIAFLPLALLLTVSLLLQGILFVEQIKKSK